jgi:tetratricopeptide (TPR) repeat protein
MLDLSHLGMYLKIRLVGNFRTSGFFKIINEGLVAMAIAKLWICPSLFIFLCFFSEPIFAQKTARCQAPMGEIVSAQGAIEFKTASSNVWNRVRVNDVICLGDTVRAGPNSRGTIHLKDGQNVVLDQRTTIQILEPDPHSSLIDLIRGGAIYVSWKRMLRTAFGGSARLEVKTPFVDGKVTGTEFLVRVEQDRTLVTVLEGNLELMNERGRLMVTSGQSAVTLAGQAPQIRILVRPRDAVQWAMYYQPIPSPLTDSSSPNAAKALQESFEEFRGGNLSRAFEVLDQMPETDRDANFYIQRAGLFLGVGQLDQARSDIDRAFALSPESGQAYALEAVIAVAQNDREKALLNGRKAVERSSGSSAAQIALSYGLQANLQLEAARDALLRAVEKQPEDSIAWARLAELWLSLGRLDRALESARTAISKRPDLGYAHTVLGFAYLAQIKISQAKAAFERAISLESESPLAHLGLGLAKIRDGNLTEGRRDIEIASALDPNDSIIRSYLGKAYYEEKRSALAEEQFSLAKELDPQDPTPYFYDAIRKQTVNRPIEALHDLQKSIELNDNRAVYRSRLLMDEDLAARSASLGRIYRDLGFEQLALVEGWKSLNIDPSNYSAHRFLADSYSVLPRHEIARDSELLQSQLLQPLNINPIQARLANDGLTFLEDAGPSSVGFNEFSRLFVSNQFRLVSDGLIGSNGIYADNLSHSGIYRNLSYGVGQYHFQTDGFRENNDLTQNIYNAFFQANVSRRDSIQAEFRQTNDERGDLHWFFEPDNFSMTQRGSADSPSIRLGFRHSFTPNSTFIGSYVHRETDSDFDFGIGFRALTNESVDFFEFRQLQNFDHIKLTGGFGYLGGDRKENLIFTMFPLPSQEQSSSFSHSNGYVYALVNYPKSVTLTLGTSVDYFKDAVERNQVNPKFGLSWTPFSGTSVRFAVFRALKRTLISSQTIEPTHVAGFSQFFDDDNATDSWRYGVAADQKLGSRVYVGSEFSKRDLTVPIRDVFTETIADVYSDEKFARVYFYFIPSDRLSLGAEYQLEQFIRDPQAFNSGALARSTTHKLPLSLSLFDPNKLFGSLKATYFNQKGRFMNSQGDVVPDSDQFWTVDFSLGYRFPQQRGLVNFEVRNLFNKKFKFQDSNPTNSTVARERLFLGRITLAF